MSQRTVTDLRPPGVQSALDELLLRSAKIATSDLSTWLAAVADALRFDAIEVWSATSPTEPVCVARHPAHDDVMLPDAIADCLTALSTRRVIAYQRGATSGLMAGLWRDAALYGLVQCARSATSSWSDAELAAVAAIADRVALMLEHAERQERTQRECELQRRETEDALRASEESYRTIFDSSNDAVFVHDLETGAVLDANQTACLFSGVTLEQLRTRGLDLIGTGPDPYTRERALEHIARAAAGTSQRFEWCSYHLQTGEELWVEVSLQRVSILGEPRLLALVRDIRERKRAEQELRRANEALEQRVAERTAELAASNLALAQSEEHFRRLIENSSDQLMIVDETAAITYVGPSVERLLGFTPEEMLGTRPNDLVHPDDVERVMGIVADIMTHPGETRVAEFRIRHKDGSWRVFENVARTMSPDSSAEGLVANGRDVTERRRAEEALREATAAAEQANRAKSEFLSRMSHELRTPMNSILGFAQILEGQQLEARQERCVQHILRAGQHLLQLINEVLEISRIEAGRHNLSLEPVRVGAVLQEAIGLARPMATQARVELEYAAFDHDDTYVQADRQRLSQVLLNLLSNAIKYNGAGGRVRVSAESDAAGTRLRVRVTDTGRGIPADRQADLFTPFARLGAENSEIEGTGLGLALSQRLMDAMSGSLTLERTGVDGSTFAIELALTQSPLDRIEENGGRQPGRVEVPHEAATLLYIEDNLANLSLVETILWERPEWRTIPALQGQIGVELAREHVPDLILLDLHLPDMRGDEVLRRLRDDERTAHIPVIVISADATRSATERLLAAGAVAFLTKPLDVAEFLATMERTLAARPRNSATPLPS